MKRFLLWLAVASLFFIAAGLPVEAQGSITISDASYKIDFPQQMTFHVSASGSSPITVAQLVIRFPQTGLVTRLPANLNPGQSIDTTAVWDLRGETSSAKGGYLPPGASGQFSWHLEDQAGNKIDTPSKPFKVDDNRRSWQTLQNDKIVLYWYDGGQDFGQAIFDKANQTLTAIQNDIGATIGTQVQIYIYGNRDEFLSALSPSNHEWAGGTIDENFSIVLINASAGDLDYALSTTPHELTHLITHAALKGPYSSVAMPLWMDEGLAVYHEYIPAQDEPRFDAAVRRGIQTDTLFRLRSLSSNFPNDTAVVDMAYGESYSVVDFMIRTYGRDKFKQIIDLFKAGTSADNAFQQVIGVDTDGLENAWRKSAGAQVKNYAKAATPTPGAAPTFAFSTADTPVPGQPTTVALQQTPAPASTPTPTPASGGGGGLCGGLFGAMGLVGFAFWRSRHT